MVEMASGTTALPGERVDEGVEDDEAGIELVDGVEEKGKIFGQAEGTTLGWMRRGGRVLDIGEDLDVREVGSQVGKLLELGGGGIGVGGDDDDVALDGWGAVWHGRAGGDGGSDLVGEQGFAQEVITIEQGDACEREAVLPEPMDGLRGGGGEWLLVDGEGVSVIARGRWGRRRKVGCYGKAIDSIGRLRGKVSLQEVGEGVCVRWQLGFSDGFGEDGYLSVWLCPGHGILPATSA